MTYWRAVWAMTRSFTKRYFRDKVALFFTFLFPLIFLFVFGSLFSGGQAGFDVAVFNHSKTPLAAGFIEELSKLESVNVAAVNSFEEAVTLMGQGELQSIVEVPENFGQPDANDRPTGNVIVYYQEGNPASGQTFAGLVEGVVGQINTHLVHDITPLGVVPRAAATTGLTQFDYTFSGLLGFSILSLGVFGMATSFTGDKKEGALRRLRVAPIGSSQLIIATLLNRLLVGVLAVSSMMAVGMLVFDFEMRGNYLTFLAFAAIGIVLMFGIGMAISGWAKNENQAAPVANLVGIPMMFLSGSFFPRYLMPTWLQGIADYLPLSPIIDGLRFIITENKALIDLGPQLLLIAGWTAIVYIIAFRIFKWE